MITKFVVLSSVGIKKRLSVYLIYSEMKFAFRPRQVKTCLQANADSEGLD